MEVKTFCETPQAPPKPARTSPLSRNTGSFLGLVILNQLRVRLHLNPETLNIGLLFISSSKLRLPCYFQSFRQSPTLIIPRLPDFDKRVLLTHWWPNFCQLQTDTCQEHLDFPGGKVSAYNAGDLGSIPGLGRFPGEEMATGTLAWKIPRTEVPRRIQFMGSQRVGRDWVTSLHEHCQLPNHKGICHLPLRRLNPLALQLLSFNTPWGNSGWTEAFCAPGSLVGQVCR